MGGRVALALSRAEHRIALLETKVARLTDLLTTVRSSLQTELDRGVITDTLWMNDSPSETIFDALDVTIAAVRLSP